MTTNQDITLAALKRYAHAVSLDVGRAQSDRTTSARFAKEAVKRAEDAAKNLAELEAKAARIASAVDQMPFMSRDGVFDRILNGSISVASYNAALREAKKRLAQEAEDARTVACDLSPANVK